MTDATGASHLGHDFSLFPCFSAGSIASATRSRLEADLHERVREGSSKSLVALYR